MQKTYGEAMVLDPARTILGKVNIVKAIFYAAAGQEKLSQGEGLPKTSVNIAMPGVLLVDDKNRKFMVTVKPGQSSSLTLLTQLGNGDEIVIARHGWLGQDNGNGWDIKKHPVTRKPFRFSHNQISDVFLVAHEVLNNHPQREAFMGYLQTPEAITDAHGDGKTTNGNKTTPLGLSKLSGFASGYSANIRIMNENLVGDDDPAKAYAAADAIRSTRSEERANGTFAFETGDAAGDVDEALAGIGI